MKAVILAGGLGRRLEPMTMTIPKVLAPLGDTPILEVVLRQLRAAGFTEAVLALGHLGELVETFVAAHRQRFQGLDITSVYEGEPTGTAGALALVPDLDETFLVMNGDILTNLDLRALVAGHRASGAPLTVAGTCQSLTVESGVLHFDPETGNLLRYEEKPELRITVSAGIYVYEPKVLRELPRGRRIDQPEVVEDLLSRRERVHCHLSHCLWYDIGTAAGYDKARQLFAEDPDLFLPVDGD